MIPAAALVMLALMAPPAGPPDPAFAVPAPPTDCAHAEDQARAAFTPVTQCIGRHALALGDRNPPDPHAVAKIVQACRAEAAPLRALSLRCEPDKAAGVDDRLNQLIASRAIDALALEQDRTWEQHIRWTDTECRIDRPDFGQVVAAGRACVEGRIGSEQARDRTPGGAAASAATACAAPRDAMRTRLTACFGPARARALMPSFERFIQAYALVHSMRAMIDRQAHGDLARDGNLLEASGRYLACVTVQARAAALTGRDRRAVAAEAERICREERDQVAHVAGNVARVLGLPSADAESAVAALDARAQALTAQETKAAHSGFGAPRHPPKN